MYSTNNKPEKLSNFERRQAVSDGILPIQRFIHSRERKNIHHAHYPRASYITDIYRPVSMREELFTRVSNNLEKVNFISTLNHITNMIYLDFMLDTAVYSRKFMDNHYMLYIGSALNSSVEPADYDTVCFAVDDVDSLALKNSSTRFPPVKIKIDFKKFLLSYGCTLGQVFIKEHDLLWTSKPDANNVQMNSTAKDHGTFARFDIPEEYSEIVKIGNIDLKIYRNACGVKFIIGDKKHVLHYNYCDGKVIEDYTPVPHYHHQAYNLQEEVNELDFGKTIFYGHPRDTEKFFVMQFFRHIEKLPKLMSLVYTELNTLSDENMVNLFNKIGHKLASGSEFDFHRGFRLPIECISQVTFLSNFDLTDTDNFKQKQFLRKNHGCNKFFSNLSLDPINIDIADIIKSVETNNINLLEKFIAIIPKLFSSERFLKYLLNFSAENTEANTRLSNTFNEIISDTIRLDIMNGR